MRVLFTGDRDWNDLALVQSILVAIQPDAVCEGGAKGLDTQVSITSAHFGIPNQTFLADWKNYHRAAGPIRNRQMYNTFKPDIVVAFHDDLANSKGTKDMVMYAKSKGTPCYLVTHDIRS